MTDLRASFIGNENRRLFAVVDGEPATANALMVVCPPLLHEHFLGYRLLALICQRLASLGIASLRFDYYGSGDSEGDDSQFSLAGAAADTATAISHLRSLGNAPLLLAGVRGGSWPALDNAANCDRLLLWQPLINGADWLSELLQNDLAERNDRMRYPLLPSLPKASAADWLLGSACGSELRNELLHADWPATPPSVAIDIAAPAGNDALSRWPTARQQTLPLALTEWIAKIDMLQHSLIGAEAQQAVDWIAAPFSSRVAA